MSEDELKELDRTLTLALIATESRSMGPEAMRGNVVLKRETVQEARDAVRALLARPESREGAGGIVRSALDWRSVKVREDDEGPAYDLCGLCGFDWPDHNDKCLVGVVLTYAGVKTGCRHGVGPDSVCHLCEGV